MEIINHRKRRIGDVRLVGISANKANTRMYDVLTRCSFKVEALCPHGVRGGRSSI